jgi:hypothetical protein
MGANAFSMTTQHRIVTSGRRERSSPSLSALCGHPRRCSTTGTRRRHARHCASYGLPDDTLEPAHGRRPDSQPLRHHPQSRSCTGTGLATTPPTGARFARTVIYSATLYTMPLHVGEIVRHACKLPPPWPIKGGAVPYPRGTGRRIVITRTLSAFTTILALASISTSGTWRPDLLSRHAFSPPLRAPQCNAI